MEEVSVNRSRKIQRRQSVSQTPGITVPRILLLEQDYRVIEELQHILSRMEYQSHFTTSHERAKDYCAENEIDLLLLDMSPGSTGGIKLVHELDCPFVVLSDGIDRQVHDICLETGLMFNIIPKPLPAQELVQTMIGAAVLASRRESRLKKNLDDGVRANYYVNTAKGILMERFRISEDRALALLRKENQSRGIKLVEVARELTDAVSAAYRSHDKVFSQFARHQV